MATKMATLFAFLCSVVDTYTELGRTVLSGLYEMAKHPCASAHSLIIKPLLFLWSAIQTASDHPHEAMIYATFLFVIQPLMIWDVLIYNRETKSQGVGDSYFH